MMRYKSTKPMTIEAQVKALIRRALDSLRHEHPDDKKLRYWEEIIPVTHTGFPEQDFSIVVQLIGESRFSRACAKVSHPEFGLWFANMNGIHGFNIGKPWRGMSPEALIESARRQPTDNPDIGAFVPALYPNLTPVPTE